MNKHTLSLYGHITLPLHIYRQRGAKALPGAAVVGVKRLVSGRFNPWLVRYTARRDYDLRKTLVIVGSSRSGTSWLEELVGTIPRFAMLFEPLHPLHVPEAAAAGFLSWNTYMARDEVWPKGERFLEKVLRGEVLNSWTTSRMNPNHAIRPERWVVKTTRAHLLLDWLVARFSIRPPLLIIRHPCATVASQMRQRWLQFTSPPSVPRFFDAYPHLANVMDEITEPVEYLTARWCIQNYNLLALPRPFPFHLVTYERLVREGESELERVFRLWEVEMPTEVRRRVRKDSQRRGGKDPLLTWKKWLSSDQIARILNIVEAFGLDFYNEDPEPDYDRLDGRSRTLSR